MERHALAQIELDVFEVSRIPGLGQHRLRRELFVVRGKPVVDADPGHVVANFVLWVKVDDVQEIALLQGAPGLRSGGRLGPRALLRH